MKHCHAPFFQLLALEMMVRHGGDLAEGYAKFALDFFT